MSDVQDNDVLWQECLQKAKVLVEKYHVELAPSEVFSTPPIAGGDFNQQAPESTDNMLRGYISNLPGLSRVVANSIPTVAQGQLTATQNTQPAYNALNLQQAQQFGVPLAQVGQQVADSNAQAGAATNLRQITGAGGDAARAAIDLSRSANPDYWQPQDLASRGATSLVNSFNLNGLSPGEANSVERANNNNLTSTGNLGNLNASNTISNAMNFGGAFNAKQAAFGQALNTATGVAQGAQNNGTNTTNVALGQPNVSTAGNFGTGTFNGTNASTQNNSANNAFQFGSGALNAVSGANNALIGAQSASNVANSVPAYMSGAGSILGGL